MVVTMPLLRLPEMAEVGASRFAPELEDSHKDPPLKKVVFTNLIDHLAFDGFVQNTPQLIRDMGAIEAARNCHGKGNREAVNATQYPGVSCVSYR